MTDIFGQRILAEPVRRMAGIGHGIQCSFARHHDQAPALRLARRTGDGVVDAPQADHWVPVKLGIDQSGLLEIVVIELPAGPGLDLRPTKRFGRVGVPSTGPSCGESELDVGKGSYDGVRIVRGSLGRIFLCNSLISEWREVMEL